nr:hypothetical protein [Tanacetum cinerariifolium]
MAESLNVSSSVVQEGVNRHVSQLSNGHVSQLSNGHVSEVGNGHVFQLSNGHVSQLPNGNAAHLPNELVSQSFREHLVAVLYREVFADMRKVDQYHRMSLDHCRSVGRLGVLIAELRDSKDWGDGDLTLGLLERLRLDNKRFPLVVKDRLLTVFNEEVGGDVTVIREYRGIECCLRISIQKREEFIGELKALGDRQGVAEIVRFIEGLQVDEMDRCNRTLSLMREVEACVVFFFSVIVLWRAGVETVYLKDAAEEDMQIATKLNRLRGEVLVLCEKRRNIAHELRIFRSIVVVSKAAEFVAESVTKTNDQASHVREGETQIEATVLEKEMYIQKIVRNMRY